MALRHTEISVAAEELADETRKTFAGKRRLKPLKEAGRRLSKKGCLKPPIQAALSSDFEHGNTLSTNGQFSRL